MFKLIYFLVFLLSGCFVNTSTLSDTGIAKESPTTDHHNLTHGHNEYSSVISLSASQVINFKHLIIQVISIEDSRCAIGTACIWAGQMVVTLEITNEQQEIRKIKLVHKRQPEIATAFNYSFLLLGINPPPKKGQSFQFNEQIVTLRILEAK